jgi:hypothetical protein
MYSEYSGFAVYWVPGSADPLGRFGADWTGWCAEAGEMRPRAQMHGLEADMPRITRRLCRHGLHGVIRVPFKVHGAPARWTLDAAMTMIGEVVATVPTFALTLGIVEGRLALLPRRPSEELRRLESWVGVGMSRGPVKRRHGLDGQREEPRHGPVFHVPLTDPLPLLEATRIARGLSPVLARYGALTARIEEIALMGDSGGDRPMVVLNRVPLREPGWTREVRPLTMLGRRVDLHPGV